MRLACDKFVVNYLVCYLIWEDPDHCGKNNSIVTGGGADSVRVKKPNKVQASSSRLAATDMQQQACSIQQQASNSRHPTATDV